LPTPAISIGKSHINPAPAKLQRLNEHLKLWRSTKMKTNNNMTLDEFKDKHYGIKGSQSRDELDLSIRL